MNGTVRLLSFAMLGITLIGGARSSAAGDCETIDKAFHAQNSQTYLMSSEGKERVLHTADNTWLKAGTIWMKVPGENPPMPSIKLSNCQQTSTERIRGVTTAVYDYDSAYEDKPAEHEKVWIGVDDGVVYEWSNEPGQIKSFEYGNLKVPPGAN